MIAATPTPVVEQLTFQFSDARDAVNPSSSNDQLDYRRAVAHAIDRPSLLAETMVPWSPETPGLLVPLGGSAWDRYPFDPAIASSLVDWRTDDSAFGEQVSAVLTTTGNGDYRIRIGDALDQAFSDVGIQYEPIYLDSVIFFGETLAQGTFDIGLWAWVNDGGYANAIALADLFDPASTADFADVGGWDRSGDRAVQRDPRRAPHDRRSRTVRGPSCRGRGHPRRRPSGDTALPSLRPRRLVARNR